MKENNVRVAVVQSAPILFNKASALTKIESWTKDAVAQEAKLVVFPEVFLSGYPRGMFLGTRVGSRNSNGRKDWERYLESSVFIPGSDTDILGAIAKESGVYLVIGVVERDSEFSIDPL